MREHQRCYGKGQLAERGEEVIRHMDTGKAELGSLSELQCVCLISDGVSLKLLFTYHTTFSDLSSKRVKGILGIKKSRLRLLCTCSTLCIVSLCFVLKTFP